MDVSEILLQAARVCLSRVHGQAVVFAVEISLTPVPLVTPLSGTLKDRLGVLEDSRLDGLVYCGSAEK